ncbi:MAG: hypothetical protein RL328_1223 [Acidobacteriota bacterium]
MGAVFLSSLCVAAPRETLRVPWQKVAQATASKQVSLTLPSGTKLRGTVLAAEREALIFNVTGTSNAKEMPKGKASLPRASVMVLAVSECSRKMRWLLTLGVPAGLLAGTAAAMRSGSPGVKGPEALGVGIAVAGGGVVGGYYLGKAFDCHVTEIVVGE